MTKKIARREHTKVARTCSEKGRRAHAKRDGEEYSCKIDLMESVG